MQKEERFEYIRKKTEKFHRVYLMEISSELKVSDDTIRRDLNEMDQLGLLTKVHGGAVARSVQPQGFHDREVMGKDEKAMLAEKALAYFLEGQTVIIDGGTTNIEVVKRFPQNLRLTVFTNSIPLAVVLCDHPSIEIIFLGGKVFKDSQVTIGNAVMETLQTFRADLYLMGVCAVHSQSGISIPDREEAEIKRKMQSDAKQTLVLATKDKLETIETYKICEYEDVVLLTN
jgi:DeoR/GlpR family transcriptional regulator of sugar metabolism